jgi:hypothetical protein
MSSLLLRPLLILAAQACSFWLLPALHWWPAVQGLHSSEAQLVLQAELSCGALPRAAAAAAGSAPLADALLLLCPAPMLRQAAAAASSSSYGLHSCHSQLRAVLLVRAYCALFYAEVEGRGMAQLAQPLPPLLPERACRSQWSTLG